MNWIKDALERTGADETEYSPEFELAYQDDDTATVYEPGAEEERWLTSDLLVEVKR